MKIGLALAGGGARGAYQIGVWKALKEAGLDQKVKIVSGASVGSINAVLFSMGDYELAEEIWMNLDKDTLFHINSDTVKRLFKERWKFFTKGVFDTSTFESMMDDVLEEELKPKIDVYIATTAIGGMNKKFFRVLKANYKFHFSKQRENLVYHKANNLERSKLKKLILASCAIPVVFRPIVIDNETYYDGGILSNMPIIPLKDCDCEKIIVVDLFRHNFHRYTEHKDERIKIIHPKRSLGGILDFNPKKIQRRFELGYQDGLTFIEENQEFLKEM